MHNTSNLQAVSGDTAELSIFRSIPAQGGDSSWHSEELLSSPSSFTDSIGPGGSSHGRDGTTRICDQGPQAGVRTAGFEDAPTDYAHHSAQTGEGMGWTTITIRCKHVVGSGPHVFLWFSTFGGGSHPNRLGF